jgi:hypothetical protein
MQCRVIDRKYSPAGSATGPGGVVVYWHVDDVAAIAAVMNPSSVVNGSEGVPARAVLISRG